MVTCSIGRNVVFALGDGRHRLRKSFRCVVACITDPTQPL